MKITKLFLVIACLLGLVASAFAQLSQTKQSRWNLDLADAQTSVSDPGSEPNSTQPQATTPVTVNPASVTPTTGTYVFNFTINMVSTIAAATKIVCSASILVNGDSLLTSVQQTAAITATRSGSTATCTVDIPYSWNLGTPATDKITPVYTIQAPVQGATLPTPFHYVHVQEHAIELPASGATTTEAVATTL